MAAVLAAADGVAAETAAVRAAVLVLEGGDEDIAIRKSVIANSGKTGNCGPRTVLTMHPAGFSAFLGEDPNLSFVAAASARVLVGSAASSSSSAQSAHDLFLSMRRRARIICCQLQAGDAQVRRSARGMASAGVVA